MGCCLAMKVGCAWRGSHTANGRKPDYGILRQLTFTGLTVNAYGWCIRVNVQWHKTPNVFRFCCRTKAGQSCAAFGTHREMTAQALLAPMLIKWLQQECSDEGLS